MSRPKGSKNKVKEVDEGSVDVVLTPRIAKKDLLIDEDGKVSRRRLKNPVVVKPEPVVVAKELPVVDGYQVVRVFAEDHDGHTQTHLLCEAESAAGDRVRLHVKKDLL